MKKFTCLVLTFALLFSLTSISAFADTQNLDKDYEIEYIDGLYHLNTKNIDKEIDKKMLEEINKRAIEEEKKETLRELYELITSDIIITYDTYTDGLTSHVDINVTAFSLIFLMFLM
jgi:hypothetical protein